MSHLHISYHWIRLSVQVDLQTLVGNCCKTPERASVEVSNFKGDHLPEHLIGCLWSEISLRNSFAVSRTRVAQVSSDLGRSSLQHFGFIFWDCIDSLHGQIHWTCPFFTILPFLSWFQYLEGLGLVLWLGTSYHLQWIKTCRNNVGIASILFISFSCASEQRTSYLEVASDSALSMQSLRLVPDMPMDDSGAYSGVLNEDIELKHIGKSVGSWLGLGMFEFVALFKYLQVASAIELSWVQASLDWV